MQELPELDDDDREDDLELKTTDGRAIDFQFERERRGEELLREDLVPNEWSDDALALGFAAAHKREWRHVASWGRWLRYHDGCWREDRVLKAFDLARRICRKAAKEVENSDPTAPRRGRLIEQVRSVKTIAAVERLARSDQMLAAVVDQWDRDPWMLNTPDGEFDLRTGCASSHRAESYCTKMTAVAPESGCPLWEDFLDRISDGDRDWCSYVKRLAGYVLTGITTEHSLHFAWGLGANGKSTFLNALQGMLGSYAGTAPMETFIESKGDRHPTDLAMLQGLRLVTAYEVEDGRRWDASRIKSLTGGDPITARYMRQDFFTYRPQFKLLIAGNHRPGLRNVDEAMRRRLHLIPFFTQIPLHERDLELSIKLQREWGGILDWAIEGCFEWQEKGLAPPACVRAATNRYFEDEDTIGTWLAECCERGSGEEFFASSADLHASFRAWATRLDEKYLSQKQLRHRIEERDFKPSRFNGKGARGFKGLRLRTSADLLTRAE